MTSQHTTERGEPHADNRSSSRRAYRSRPLIENALRLDIRPLRRAGLFREGRFYGTLNRAFDDRLMMTLTFEAIITSSEGWLEIREGALLGPLGPKRMQRIELMTTTPRYGGKRWWFRCPTTGKRAAVLLHFENVDGFHSRQAFDPPPTYPCQRTSRGMHIYERMAAIHRKLKFDGPLIDTPPRPKHMRRWTYAQHLAELGRLWDSPENPVTRFAKTIRDLAALEGNLPIDLGSLDLASTCLMPD